jgi:hypothetical protein
MAEPKRYDVVQIHEGQERTRFGPYTKGVAEEFVAANAKFLGTLVIVLRGEEPTAEQIAAASA